MPFSEHGDNVITLYYQYISRSGATTITGLGNSSPKIQSSREDAKNHSFLGAPKCTFGLSVKLHENYNRSFGGDSFSQLHKYTSSTTIVVALVCRLHVLAGMNDIEDSDEVTLGVLLSTDSP